MVEDLLEATENLLPPVLCAKIIGEQAQCSTAPVDQAEVPAIHRLEHSRTPELLEHGHVLLQVREVRQDRRERDDMLLFLVRLVDRPFECLLQIGNHVPRVPAEDLIPALPAQDDLHVVSGQA